MTARSLVPLALLMLGASAWAQGPARFDILAQCPGLAEQLPEQLASIQHEVHREGTVRVQLVVDPQGVQRIEALDGPRPYRARVRSVLNGVACTAPTPQRYVLTIRFQDGIGAQAQQMASAQR